MDTRAVAAVVAAVAFVAGSFVAGQRTDEVVSDQAQVTRSNTEDAKELVDARLEKVREHLAYRACRTENFRRANTRLDSRTQEKSDRKTNRARYQEPILNCRASAKSLDDPVFLSRTEQTKYIELVRRGRAPVVHNGKVDGSQSFRR